jgi:hypothetical protein
MVDPVLSLVIGAFGAALLSAVAGFVGSRINARREHERWKREQRLTAYLDYVRIAERLPTIKKTTTDVALLESLQSATASLRLLGPASVFNAAIAHTAAAIVYSGVMGEPDANKADIPRAGLELSTTREKLVAAAQLELGIES